MTTTTTLDNPEGLRATLDTLLAEQGTGAELAFVVGVVQALATNTQHGAVRRQLTPEEQLAQIRQVLDLHQEASIRNPHGAFSLCTDGCHRCAEATRLDETSWHAAMQARGVQLRDVSTLSAEKRAAHARDGELAEMAAEHAAAADPDYGRDLDGDD